MTDLIHEFLYGGPRITWWHYVLFNLVIFRGILLPKVSRFLQKKLFKPVERWLLKYTLKPLLKWIKRRFIKTEYDMALFIHNRNKQIDKMHSHRR